MRDAMQPSAPAQAPPAAPGQPGQPEQPPAAAGPMTREQVQATLDNLDMRLAAGEISEETYNRLYARWEQKLKELDG